MLYQILYTSRSVHPRGHLSDLDILRTAAKCNSQQDITGALLRTDRRFMQFLEGDQARLEQLMAKLKTDDRHFELDVLLQRPAASRCFDSWSMGYAEINTDGFEHISTVSKGMPEPFEHALGDIRSTLQSPAV